MMNDFAAALVDGLSMLEEVTGATLTYRGKAYPCTGGAEARGKKIDLGGFQFHSDCPLVVRASVFGKAGPPSQKQEIVFCSGPGATARGWRVDEVRTVWGEIVVLECNDPSQ
jgi:hypothetical protein